MTRAKKSPTSEELSYIYRDQLLLERERLRCGEDAEGGGADGVARGVLYVVHGFVG